MKLSSILHKLGDMKSRQNDYRVSKQDAALAQQELVNPFKSRTTYERCTPKFFSFVLVYVAYSVLAWRPWEIRSGSDLLDWYVSIMWSLPVISAAIGIAGGLRTAFQIRHRAQPLPSIVHEMLIVVVPTIGRQDTYPALKRVLQSFCRELPSYFPNSRIDLIVEEDCQIRKEIAELANSLIRVVTIPGRYQTPNGSRFKARANHYAHALRIAEGEARDDVWVLHMDDDTGISSDTALELAHFVACQRLAGKDAFHLAQGVLCYPREYAQNRLTWLADSIRPGCDMSTFAATTGQGSPRVGLHGEILLIRAAIEADIGWDFGSRAIVEDAQFALIFCDRYPGRSCWIPGRSYGASPATVRDFIRQRERWVWGLLELAVEGQVPLKRRLILIYAVGVWIAAAFAHPVIVIFACIFIDNFGLTPASMMLFPLWAFNTAFLAWLYWEGFMLNSASSMPSFRTLWWERLCLIPLIPLFSFWEAVGAWRGIFRFLQRRDPVFTVIRKPA